MSPQAVAAVMPGFQSQDKKRNGMTFQSGRTLAWRDLRLEAGS